MAKKKKETKSDKKNILIMILVFWLWVAFYFAKLPPLSFLCWVILFLYIYDKQ